MPGGVNKTRDHAPDSTHLKTLRRIMCGELEMKRLSVIGLLFGAAWSVYAGVLVLIDQTPAGCETFEITGVTGTIGDGNTLTITGCGFGANGPTLVIYDEFELHGGASVDDEIDTTATVGSWTGGSAGGRAGGIPNYKAHPHSGSHSALGVEGYDNGGSWDASPNAIVKVTAAPFHNIFWSFAVMVPDGYTFPGSTVEDAFPPSGSIWKMSWIYKTCCGVNDFVAYSHNNGSGHILSGNDVGGEYASNGWAFDVWNRFSFSYDWGPTNTGTMQIAHNVREGIGFNDDDTAPFTLEGGTSPYEMQRIEIPAWAGNNHGDWQDVRVVYDDVYVAIGDYANARVEIGDNATYKSSTRLTFVTVEDASDWGDTQIEGTLRQQSFPDTFPGAQDLWLWVTKAGFPETRTSYKIN